MRYALVLLASRFAFAVIFSLMLVFVPGMARAEDEPAAEPAPAPSEEFIQQAFALAKDDATADALNEALAALDKAEQAGLAAERVDYVRRLKAWVYNRRGELASDRAAELHRAGKAEEAAQADAAALADFDESVNLNDRRWRAVHNRAVSLAQKGDYEAALRDFNATLALFPNYPNAWLNRAELQVLLLNYEAALADYNRVLQLDPRSVDALAGRANALYRLERANEALADYNRAIALAPNRALWHVRRGELLTAIGNWNEAMRDFRRALQLEENNADALLGAAWLLATCPEERLRNAEESKTLAERAAKLAPSDSYRPGDVLAAAHAEAGNFDEAVKAIDAALALENARERLDEATLAVLQARRELYMQQRPFRQRTNRRLIEATRGRR